MTSSPISKGKLVPNGKFTSMHETTPHRTAVQEMAGNRKTSQELPDLRRVGIVALDIPGGSEFEHNPVGAQNGAGGHDVIPEVCAECHLNPPDGSEQLRRLTASENLWLHRRCEDTFIRRRMAEEGISWSTMPRSTAPAPSVGKTIDANGGSPPPHAARRRRAGESPAATTGRHADPVHQR